MFGVGARHRIAAELAARSAVRVLLITGGSATRAGEELAEAAGDRVVARFGEIAQHVPEALARRATEAARAEEIDHLLSVGGGSATGLAKAVAVELGTPVVAVPTTYAGSEMTPIWAVTGDRKRTGTDEVALPVTVIYDPELTVGLPRRVSAASGMNALAQAIAALSHQPEDPIATLQADEAVRELAGSLPRITERPDDLEARGRALYGACLAARSLAATGTGLHHELAHILGGRYGLVHADVHAALLPHTTARLRTLDPAGLERLAAVLDTEDPAERLFRLAGRTGAPTRLDELGVGSDAVQVVLDDLQHDRLPADEVRRLLEDAIGGADPGADRSG